MDRYKQHYIFTFMEQRCFNFNNLQRWYESQEFVHDTGDTALIYQNNREGYVPAYWSNNRWNYFRDNDTRVSVKGKTNYV